MCYLRLVFPIDFQSEWFIHWCKWGVKVPYSYVLLLISPFMFIKVCFIYLRAPICGIYIFTIFIYSYCISPLIIIKYPSLSLMTVFFSKFSLSDKSVAIPAFFSFLFTLNIFSHPLTFCEWFYRFELCLLWFCFCIHSASLCLFIEALIYLHWK